MLSQPSVTLIAGFTSLICQPVQNCLNNPSFHYSALYLQMSLMPLMIVLHFNLTVLEYCVDRTCSNPYNPNDPNPDELLKMLTYHAGLSLSSVALGVTALSAHVDSLNEKARIAMIPL